MLLTMTVLVFWLLVLRALGLFTGCPKTLCDNFSLHFVGEVIATLVIHIKHVDPRL